MPRIEVRALTNKPDLRFAVVAVDANPRFLLPQQFETELVDWKQTEDGSLQLKCQFDDTYLAAGVADAIASEYVHSMHEAGRLRDRALVYKVEIEAE